MLGDSSKHNSYRPSGIILVFASLLFLLIAIRVQNFLNINLNYIDSDQPFMWAGASDYAKGLFYEPRFYGQNYNSFMEALVAVPFIWCGISVYYALPLATHLLFLFPVVFTATWLFAKGYKLQSVMVLGLVLCLTPAFDIMVSLPRGFVNGLFFSSFFILNIIQPNNLKAATLNFVMVIVGYFVSPNSLLVSVPFLLWLFLNNYTHKAFYIRGLLSCLLYLPLYFFFDYFYKQHPEYVVYGFEHEFSWKFFMSNLQNPEQAFAHINFFVENGFILLLILIGALAYLLLKQNKNGFVAMLAFLFMLLLTFATGKSRDGTLWPWYSYSRIYLGVPVFLYLFLSQVSVKQTNYFMLLVLIPIAYSIFKLVSFKDRLPGYTNEKIWHGVHLVSLNSALDAIQFYGSACKKQEVDFFLISNGFWLNTFLNYGGPSVSADFPETMETNSERRYWVKEKYKSKVVPKFVFLSQNYNFDKLLNGNEGFKLQRLDDYGLVLITDNKLPCGEFIKLSRQLELAAGGS